MRSLHVPKPHEVLQPEAVAPEVVKPGVTRAATSAAEVVLCFMFIAPSESAVTNRRENLCHMHALSRTAVCRFSMCASRTADYGLFAT